MLKRVSGILDLWMRADVCVCYIISMDIFMNIFMNILVELPTSVFMNNNMSVFFF